MKEAIVILTLLGCDHGENNCYYIETASQTYTSQIACLRASEDQILSVADVEYPIIMADCKLQSKAVAESDIKELLENELHEPNLTPNEIAVFEAPRRPVASALGTIKNVGGYAIDSVWNAAINSTSAINPF